MTLREFTALIRLFEACADPALRRRAIELVPELAEWDKRRRSQEVIDIRPQRRLTREEEIDRIRWR